MATDRFNSFSPAGKPFHADDFSLSEVVGQYDSFFKLGLTEEEKRDLIQDLLAPPARGSNGVTGRRETEEPVNPGGWS